VEESRSSFSIVVTRRQLLRIGSLLAAVPLAACGQPASPAAPTPAPAKPGPAEQGSSKPTAAAATPAEAAKPAAAAAPATASARGSAGTVKILLWQAPTIVNPHLAQGTKDFIASRCCLEPLLTVDGEGNLSPVLAAEVPSRENGGVGADGTTVTYKLKPGVTWADGQPLTAEDVAFTFEFASNPESSATTAGTYLTVDKVEALDALTVRLTFKEPTAGWYVPFVGANGMILPKHALKDHVGTNARNAPFNLKSFGTGPFVVDDFKPGDLVIYRPNPNYRDPGKPFFDRIEMKGGGDAVSAARAVFQTGEYDYAWNLLVEAQVLEQVMQGGKGELVTAPGSGVEQIYFNQADPWTEIDGERNHPSSKHPFLTDLRVRQAMALAIDRETIAKQLFGPTGDATANVLTTPTRLASKNTKYEFNVDKGNALLDEAGYRRGGDGIRVSPGGVRLKVVYATSINSLRQKVQALIKDGWQKLGIETELKSVDAGVFFSSAPGNPDTTSKFNADVQMFNATFDSPYPASYMKRFYGRDPARDWAQKANNWAPQNYHKWSDDEYNRLYEQAQLEQDPEKNRQIWIRMNDIVVDAHISVPLVERKFASGRAKGLEGTGQSPFDSETHNIADWKK
jgi:peptide/nickel transport system substrate-binding protein